MGVSTIQRGVFYHTRNHTIYYLQRHVRNESKGREVWVGRTFKASTQTWGREREIILTIAWLDDYTKSLPAVPTDGKERPVYVTRRAENINDVLGSTLTGAMFGKDLSLVEEVLQLINSMRPTVQRLLVVGLQQKYLDRRG